MEPKQASIWTLATLSALLLAAGVSAPAAAVAVPGGTVIIRPAATTANQAGTPNAFLPPDVISTEDGMVTFNNQDTRTHRPADVDDACFNTGNIAAGDDATIDVSSCGSSGTVISYECEIHPSMIGTVTIA